MPTLSGKVKNNEIIFDVAVSNFEGGQTYIHSALLDTGAQVTGVTQKVLKDLGILEYPSGQGRMKTASGTSYPVEKHRLRIEIESVFYEKSISGGSAAKIDSIGQSLEVILLPATYQPDNHSIILGMDFILKVHLTIFSGRIQDYNLTPSPTLEESDDSLGTFSIK